MIHIPISASTPYAVHLGSGLLDSIGTWIPGEPCRAMIISDDTVFGLYGAKLRASLERDGYSTDTFVFPAGEASKRMDTLCNALEALAAGRFSRKDLVVALGGGVTGDLGGFAAACYQRGIRYVQCPTTLLAMVDSSVGGKTGVDLNAGKNLAGAFHQPVAVAADTQTLATLSPQIMRQGEAEMLKYGMLGNKKLFEAVSQGTYGEEEIAACIRSKAELVKQDEHDHGARQLLNLGHTLGHGVEKLSDYQVPHGDAVAIGMALITRAACALGLCARETLKQLEAALAARNLPTQTEYSAQELFEAAHMDKKGSDQGITVVLPLSVGQCRLEKMTWPQLEKLIRLAKEG